MALRGMLTEYMDKNNEETAFPEKQSEYQEPFQEKDSHPNPASSSGSWDHNRLKPTHEAYGDGLPESPPGKMSIVCPNCGKQVPLGSSFCGFCGARHKLPDGFHNRKKEYRSTNNNPGVPANRGIKMTPAHHTGASTIGKSKIGLIATIVICLILGCWFFKSQMTSRSSDLNDSKTISYSELPDDQKHVIDSIYENHEDWESVYDSGQTFYCKGVKFFEYEGVTLFVAGIPLSNEDSYESGRTEGGTSIASGGPIATVLCQINENGDTVKPTVDPPTGTRMAMTYVLRNYNAHASEEDKLDTLANAYISYLQP